MFPRHASFALGTILLAVAHAAQAATPTVLDAETSVYLDANMMQTQYQVHGGGQSENGFAPGFGVGASALLPTHPNNPNNVDFYTALDYQFNAGNLSYNGGLFNTQTQVTTSISATERAVFQRIEARIGAGFQTGGVEIIPFFAAGYQSWNRNVDITDVSISGDFYHAALLGFGGKLDVPVGDTLVASGTAEVLGLVGGGVTINNQDFGHSMGATPEERLEFGLDDAVGAHFHLFAKGYWEQFNYAGTQPVSYGIYSLSRPFSTTSQYGVNIGAGYTF